MTHTEHHHFPSSVIRSASLVLLAAGGQEIGRFRYRLTQGLRTLSAPILPLDTAARERALAILPAAAAAAFRALPKADQHHALRVHAMFVGIGETDRDLLAAALLHDVGKYPGVGLTQRVARVLLARRPRLLAWLARDARPFRRWRRGMRRLLDHAALGADLAAGWGCSPATVTIIRASHDPDALDAVRRLQAADDRT